MKTIDEASLENSKNHYMMAFSEQLHFDADMDFRAGAEWMNQQWQEKTRWIPVDEEKPKSKKIVWIKVINRHGKEHTSLAQYVPPKTVLASDFMLEDDSECEEYDEVIDDYYVIEGWWEYQYEAETNWYIRDTVTHYREIIE